MKIIRDILKECFSLEFYVCTQPLAFFSVCNKILIVTCVASSDLLTNGACHNVFGFTEEWQAGHPKQPHILLPPFGASNTSTIVSYYFTIRPVGRGCEAPGSRLGDCSQHRIRWSRRRSSWVMPEQHRWTSTAETPMEPRSDNC